MPKTFCLFLLCSLPLLSFGQKNSRNGGVNFHMRVLAGGTYSSLKVTGITNTIKTQPIFTAGLEGEANLPFHRRKWSVVLNSAYNAYPNSTAQIGNYIYSITYKTIDFQLGLRYLMFLGETTKLYVNPSLVYYVPINSEINTHVPKSGVTYSITAGCAFNRFSFELRYFPERSIVSDTDISARYWAYSFLLGYQLF